MNFGFYLGLLAFFAGNHGIKGEEFDPNPTFFKYMNYASSSFAKLSQEELEELIDMVKRENIYTISTAKPEEIRRFFDENDLNTDSFALLGRLSAFLTQKGYGGFCPVRNVTCFPENNYRSYDGLCNNLKNPTWGSFLGKFNRFLEPQYEDGKQLPRGASYSKEDGYKSRLPSPRKISATLHEDVDSSSTELTHFYMQFGQFLSHDIAKSTKGDLDCCHKDLARDPRCFNIDLTNDEFFYEEFNRTCMEFTRSDSHCGYSNEWREQFNSVTAYFDCSTVYGSFRGTNRELRKEMTDGTLRSHPSMAHFLPTRKHLGSHLYKSENGDDYISGDGRCQSQSTLLAMHTLWFREHNRIAKALGPILREHIRHLRPVEQDEIIFQESRKIVIAEFTNVVYSEYLPILLPSDCPGVRLTPNSKYDPEVDASLLNEFVTVAYRFGHSLVQGVFEGIDQAWRLGSFFSDPQFATSFEGRGVDKELLGAIHQPCQDTDRFISKELTHKLFLNKELMNHTENWRGMGSDLAALNIQRGRDHGIPDYNSVREKCGLSRIDKNAYDSSDVPDQFEEASWEKLKSVYNSVDDFDFFPAGLSEKKKGGKRLGETFHCLICEQFTRLKDGDRFFFTHAPDENTRSMGLHIDLQSMILRRKLSDILCENSENLDKLKVNVFRKDGLRNPEKDCRDNSRNKIDFGLVVRHFKWERRTYPRVKIMYP